MYLQFFLDKICSSRSDAQINVPAWEVVQRYDFGAQIDA